VFFCVMSEALFSLPLLRELNLEFIIERPKDSDELIETIRDILDTDNRVTVLCLLRWRFRRYLVSTNGCVGASLITIGR